MSRFFQGVSGLAFMALVMSGGPAAAIDFGQVDEFDDGTAAGWRKGSPSGLPVTNVPDGGPDGAGDNFLRNESTGTGGADSRQVFFNTAQWAGNYNLAAVGAITMWARNFGRTALHLRIAIQGAGSTRYASSTARLLPANSAWTHLQFDLTGSSLTRIAGSADLPTVLSNVGTLRILSAQLDPAWEGDEVASTLGVDRILARSTVVPVIEHSWGRVKETFRQP